jgi:hypothetical protein
MGLFDKLIAVFSGGNDPRALKLRHLRRIAKALKENRYGKFYKPKTGELCAPLGKFFWELYRLTASAQLLLRDAAKSEELKKFCVVSFLDDNLKTLGGRLTADAIGELAAGGQDDKELIESIKKDLARYTAGFDALLISGADKCYNAITAFLHFIAFDFYFVLKKFDSGISERNFSYQPRFQPVNGAELLDELKDFMEAAAPVEVEQDWKTPLNVLKLYKKDTDAVNPGQWTKALHLLREVGASGVLELIIQHSSKDPVWQFAAKPLAGRIAAAYLDAKKAEVEGAIRKIQDAKRDAQISQIAIMIFGSPKVDRMINYTEEAGKVFAAKGFDGFTKTGAMNYLRVFLIDFFKSEMKDLCDLFLVRGQWTNPELAQQMSGNYYEIMAIAEKVIAFDRALSESGEHGARLRQALQKSGYDKGQARYVRIILNTVNNDAQCMINDAASHLAVIGKNLKTLLEDHQQVPPVLIINWKDLETASEMSLHARITAALKKICHFIQLLQFFAAPVTET